MGYNFFENFFVLCHGAKVAIKKETDKLGERENGEWEKGGGRRGEKFALVLSGLFLFKGNIQITF
jgi:hypothetical protein